MDGGLLSLKWNNHKSSFFNVLSTVRKKKDNYADVTLACDGKFYPVHKLVLSSCSDYFEDMFEQSTRADCKHPFIVLKDIKSDELECLLSYMYVGEVNVLQEKLSGLIKAAECLRIKGLAVPDEEATPKPREKRSNDSNTSSEAKRKKSEDSVHNSNKVNSNFRESVNRNEDRRKSSVENNRSKNYQSQTSSKDVHKNVIEDKPLVNTDHSKENIKTEVEDEPTDEVLIEEEPSIMDDAVKAEPNDQDHDVADVYLDNADHMNKEEAEQLMMPDFSEQTADNHHFMDELLGDSSGSDARQMGEYMDPTLGDGSMSTPGGSQPQQPMVMYKRGRTSPVKPFDEIVDSCRVSIDGNLRFICNICSKISLKKDHFRIHYRTHTGEKPYVCIYCGVCFGQKPNLNFHITRHHTMGVVNKTNVSSNI